MAVNIPVYLAVFYLKAELLCLFVCSLNGEVCLFGRDLSLVIHLAGNVLECFADLITKSAISLQRIVCKRICAIHTAFQCSGSKHHFRVIIKVFVDICALPAISDIAVRGLKEGLTSIFCAGRPLFQNKNIRYHLSTGITGKRCVGKADSAQQVGAVHNVLPDGVILTVHCKAGGDEHDHAAGTYLVKCLCKEIVVDSFCDTLWIAAVYHAIVAERHIAYGNIHVVVRDISCFKALNAYIGVRVQVLSNLPCDAVQLHHRPALYILAHAGRHTANKVTNAAGRLQHAPACKPKLRKAIIHGLNNLNGSIVRVLGACAHGIVFFLGDDPVCHKLP